MTKYSLFVALIIMLATFLAACSMTLNGTGVAETVSGSRNVVSETREVSGFTAVSLQGAGAVIIDQTGSELLTITADDSFLPYLVTEVRRGTLYIRVEEQAVFTNVTELTFHINATALNSVELSGAGSVSVSHLDAENWRASLPGAGSITVSGRAAAQTVTLTGAGNYQAADLESQEATIRSSGAGMAVVRVSDKLDVTIDGLGTVEYIGNPTVTQTINGLGRVSQRN